MSFLVVFPINRAEPNLGVVLGGGEAVEVAHVVEFVRAKPNHRPEFPEFDIEAVAGLLRFLVVSRDLLLVVTEKTVEFFGIAGLELRDLGRGVFSESIGGDPWMSGQASRTSVN